MLTDVAEIKRLVSVSSAAYRLGIKLERSGDSFKAPCPFHKEDTPSFFVNDKRMIFKCFGCGESGDAISLVAKIKGLEFLEASKLLCEMFGLSITFSKVNSKLNNKYSLALSINEVSKNYFIKQLLGSSGLLAREYLEMRHVFSAEINKFSIGYCPTNPSELADQILSLGDLAKDLAIELGILKISSRGSLVCPYYDRICFPICDAVGKTVGFSCRSLNNSRDSTKARYINSPASFLFKKGELVYGMQQAFDASKSKTSQICIVEGLLDVVAMDYSGMPCVGTMGTATNPKFAIDAWQRGIKNILICMDGDASGIKASKSLFEQLLPYSCSERQIFCCWLPIGKDPNNILATDGKEFLINYIENKKMSICETIVAIASEGKNFSVPEDVAAAKERAVFLVNKIQSKMLSKECFIYVNARIKGRYSAFQKNEKQGDKGFIAYTNKNLVNNIDPMEAINKYFDKVIDNILIVALCIIVKNPWLLENIDMESEEALSLLKSKSDSGLNSMLSSVWEILYSTNNISTEDICLRLRKCGHSDTLERVLFASEGLIEVSESPNSIVQFWKSVTDKAVSLASLAGELSYCLDSGNYGTAFILRARVERLIAELVV